MSRVYVTQENANFDYTPLNGWGDVKFVTRNDFSGSANSILNADIMHSIDLAMSAFDVDNDYLVPSGSPLVTSFCVAKLAKLGVTRFPILRWSNRDHCYYPITISI